MILEKNELGAVQQGLPILEKALYASGKNPLGKPQEGTRPIRRNHHAQDRMMLSCFRPNRKRSKSSTDNLGLYQDDVWGRSRGHLGTTRDTAGNPQYDKSVSPGLQAFTLMPDLPLPSKEIILLYF